MTTNGRDPTPTVSTRPPAAEGQAPSVVLHAGSETVLSGPQAVQLAGDLLEGAGRIARHLEPSEQMRVGRLMSRIAAMIFPRS